MLSGITHRNKETLHGYIGLFAKMAVVVGGTKGELKCWIFEKGLRLDNMFRENLGLKEACSLKYLLSMTQPYINCVILQILSIIHMLSNSTSF